MLLHCPGPSHRFGLPGSRIKPCQANCTSYLPKAHTDSHVPVIRRFLKTWGCSNRTCQKMIAERTAIRPRKFHLGDNDMAVNLYTVATTEVGTSVNSYLRRQSITYYDLGRRSQYTYRQPPLVRYMVLRVNHAGSLASYGSI